MSTAKKILWLSSSYPRSENDSASIFLRHLANSIVKNKFELHIISPDDSNIDPHFQEPDISHHRFRYFLPKHNQKLAYGSGILPNLKENPWLIIQIPFFLTALWVSTGRTIHKIKPDVIHAHWLIPQGLIAVFWGRIFNIPVITTTHGGDAFALRGSLLARFKKWTIKKSTVWTSNTHATATAVGNQLPQPAIIPMGVHCTHFNTSPKPAKYPKNAFVLLFVGRLVAKKGVADLLTAFSQLSAAQREHCELWIIGDGAERQALENQAKQLNINKKVTFYGRIPNALLPDYYAQADIFIAPSVMDKSGDTEGQGVILLEAMASGTPIISTQTGGIAEVISHELTGLLIPPSQPQALKNAIERLLIDHELRHFLAKKGQEHASAYDWPVIAERFATLYHQVSRR